MPIFTKCNFDSPLRKATNDPVNLSVCSMVLKSEKCADMVIFPAICFITESRVHHWIFESEQDRDSEFKRIMSI